MVSDTSTNRPGPLHNSYFKSWTLGVYSIQAQCLLYNYIQVFFFDYHVICFCLFSYTKKHVVSSIPVHRYKVQNSKLDFSTIRQIKEEYAYKCSIKKHIKHIMIKCIIVHKDIYAVGSQLQGWTNHGDLSRFAPQHYAAPQSNSFRGRVTYVCTLPGRSSSLSPIILH